MNFIGQRSAILPRVPRSRQLSDSWISRAIHLTSVGTSPVPSLLSGTIKNVGGHCCGFYYMRKAVRITEMNYWSEGDLHDRHEITDIYMMRGKFRVLSSDHIKRIIGSIITRTGLRELINPFAETISRSKESKTEECACNAGLASDKYIYYQQRVSKSARCISRDNWDRFIFCAQAPLLVFRLEVSFTALHLPTFPVPYKWSYWSSRSDWLLPIHPYRCQTEYIMNPIIFHLFFWGGRGLLRDSRGPGITWSLLTPKRRILSSSNYLDTRATFSTGEIIALYIRTVSLLLLIRPWECRYRQQPVSSKRIGIQGWHNYRDPVWYRELFPFSRAKVSILRFPQNHLRKMEQTLPLLFSEF